MQIQTHNSISNISQSQSSSEGSQVLQSITKRNTQETVRKKTTKTQHRLKFTHKPKIHLGFAQHPFQFSSFQINRSSSAWS